MSCLVSLYGALRDNCARNTSALRGCLLLLFPAVRCVSQGSRIDGRRRAFRNCPNSLARHMYIHTHIILYSVPRIIAIQDLHIIEKTVLPACAHGITGTRPGKPASCQCVRQSRAPCPRTGMRCRPAMAVKQKPLRPICGPKRFFRAHSCRIAKRIPAR